MTIMMMSTFTRETNDEARLRLDDQNKDDNDDDGNDDDADYERESGRERGGGGGGGGRRGKEDARQETNDKQLKMTSNEESRGMSDEQRMMTSNEQRATSHDRKLQRQQPPCINKLWKVQQPHALHFVTTTFFSASSSRRRWSSAFFRASSTFFRSSSCLFPRLGQSSLLRRINHHPTLTPQCCWIDAGIQRGPASLASLSLFLCCLSVSLSHCLYLYLNLSLSVSLALSLSIHTLLSTLLSAPFLSSPSFLSSFLPSFLPAFLSSFPFFLPSFFPTSSSIPRSLNPLRWIQHPSSHPHHPSSHPSSHHPPLIIRPPLLLLNLCLKWRGSFARRSSPDMVKHVKTTFLASLASFDQSMAAKSSIRATRPKDRKRGPLCGATPLLLMMFQSGLAKKEQPWQAWSTAFRGYSAEVRILSRRSSTYKVLCPVSRKARFPPKSFSFWAFGTASMGSGAETFSSLMRPVSHAVGSQPNHHIIESSSRRTQITASCVEQHFLHCSLRMLWALNPCYARPIGISKLCPPPHGWVGPMLALRCPAPPWLSSPQRLSWHLPLQHIADQCCFCVILPFLVLSPSLACLLPGFLACQLVSQPTCVPAFRPACVRSCLRAFLPARFASLPACLPAWLLATPLPPHASRAWMFLEAERQKEVPIAMHAMNGMLLEAKRQRRFQ